MNWLSRLFGKTQTVAPNLLLIRKEIETESYKWKQGWEDRRVEIDARSVAEDLFHQWLADQPQDTGILVQKPVRCTITQYPGCEPKYDSEGYQKLIRKIFKSMQDDYLLAKKSKF